MNRRHFYTNGALDLYIEDTPGSNLEYVIEVNREYVIQVEALRELLRVHDMVRSINDLGYDLPDLGKPVTSAKLAGVDVLEWDAK